jgi:S-DNA-T family DNA segregation ATPase FtsK/SpoIIIE
MTTSEIVGEVGRIYLGRALGLVASSDDAEGTARFILDRLTVEQAGAIARALLADEDLSQKFEIKLPASLMAGEGLPDSALTHERATLHRHAECSKPALLLANTGDDEEQSLGLVTPVGALQLLSDAALWIEAAGGVSSLGVDQQRWWQKALTGVIELNFRSLDQIATYVLKTKHAIEDEGFPIVAALGYALPALDLPRDTNGFSSINSKQLGHIHKWRNLFATFEKKRASYLRKLTPSQVLLNTDDLRGSFAKVKDSIREELHQKILTFIEAPASWNSSSAALAECEWTEIEPIFSGLRPEKLNLGDATLEFYDDSKPGILSQDETEYLKRLITASREPEDEDRDFYEAHRDELKEDRKLKSLWDRFIFGSPRESEDFLIGIVRCMEVLFNQNSNNAVRKLTLRCDHTSKKDFRELNVDAGIYFATRYRGLRRLLGSKVDFKVGPLFEFPSLVEAWRAKNKTTLNWSIAKAALQIKFTLELEVTGDDGDVTKSTAQLLWRFNPNTVATELAPDWNRLVEHPLVYASAHREPVSGKGQVQSVDLSNARTFVAAFDKDRGSFVSAYRKENNLADHWLANLESARSQGLVAEEVALELRTKFDAFVASYTKAIEGFAIEGLASDCYTEQAKAYGSLLEVLCGKAKGDKSRELLLKPIVQIGTVCVLGGIRPAAIVAPWHPLRLLAMHVKAQRFTGLLRNLLSAPEIDFGDARLFFRDVVETLAHPFYPEIVLGWQGRKAELLAMTDVVADYTLHEPPLTDEAAWQDTNESPTEAAEKVAELMARYLALNPHEQANFSVVLYNCDSARLPQAVVDRLGAMQEDQEDVRCQIILRHRDTTRLRSLYEKIVEAVDSDLDFMARLRIGIMADQAPPPDPREGCPSDIVFSQDVIARHALLEWYPVDARPIPPEELVPPQWSRRMPAARDDMKSVVFLCCPAQTSEGWSYLNAITTFLRQDWSDLGSRRLLPARQLDFQDPAMAEIFEETHRIGTWVVNYDELLDRRQLLNQSVRVIRYKQSTTQGRNLVISSRASLDLLRTMVLKRIRGLNLGIPENEEAGLAERFIQDANEISGEIVLRAARRGKNASELMGVVLSAFLIRQEIGVARNYGWYFLDDYADWLGQREEQIADILALSPEAAGDGSLRLAVIVSEAKYILHSSLSAKRKESNKQLGDTVRRIEDALFGSPERLDRNLWLSRFSDLVLNGIQFPATSPVDLPAWRRSIPEGECQIFLRGYSHVFISGPGDSPECSEVSEVPNGPGSMQEIFSYARLRELALHYHANTQPLAVRIAIAGEDQWKEQVYRSPEPLPKTTKVKRNSNATLGPTGGGAATAPVPQIRQASAASATTETPPTQIAPPPVAPAPSGPQPQPRPSFAGSSVPSAPIPAPAATVPTVALPSSSEEQAGASCWPYPGVAKIVAEFTGDQANTEADLTWLRQTERNCKSALQQFQLQSKLESSSLTPNAALLNFVGTSDLTIEQVLRRRTEFLTTHKLNVISVTPRAGAIAIAIGRPHRQILELPTVWKGWEPNCQNGNHDLLIAVREEDSSHLILSPRQHAPHTLIAGATGSGKSVLMQNIILAIAATNTPEQAQITIIDPKLGVDYFGFEGLPHLEGGIVDTQAAAIGKLNSLVAEMERRYAVIRENRVSNVFDLSAKVDRTESLPFLWVIHDEFADWMMIPEYRDEVTAIVGRLGVKARAAGISLVFAAQRPDVNVMPMQLRENLGNRLILRVSSEGTSEIALGERGAERLLGKGHLAAKLEGEPSIVYGQVPFVTPQTLEAMVAAITGV